MVLRKSLMDKPNYHESDNFGENYVQITSELLIKSDKRNDYEQNFENSDTDKILAKLKDLTESSVGDQDIDIDALSDISFNGITLEEHEKTIEEQSIKKARRTKNGNVDTVQQWAEKFKETHDTRYWEKIQKQLWPGLVAHCYKVTRKWELAEDVASVILMRAYERIDDYDIMKAKFGTWVWCIGFRQACRDLIIEKRQPASLSSVASADDGLENYVMGVAVAHESSDEDTNTNGMFTDVNDVEHGYADSVQTLYDASIAAIKHITPTSTRDVLTLKLLENKTIAQISTMLNMTPSNVKNHLYRGKRQIAEMIKTDNATSDAYNTYIEAGHIING